MVVFYMQFYLTLLIIKRKMFPALQLDEFNVNYIYQSENWQRSNRKANSSGC